MTLWLAKFPTKGHGPDAGAVEYAYSRMAKAAGIDMPPTTLLPSKEIAGYFTVERFDRTATGGRLHMHSLGGLLNASTANSALGYRELMTVTGSLTQRSGTDIPSIEQQIARMAFNVIARNRDDHVKNHAFLMDESGTWRPAPAFDLTYSNFQEHALLVGDAGREPGLADMLAAARHVRIPDDRTIAIVERVRAAVADWKLHAKEANLTPSLARDIDASVNPAGGGGGGARQTAHVARRSSMERRPSERDRALEHAQPPCHYRSLRSPRSAGHRVCPSGRQPSRRPLSSLVQRLPLPEPLDFCPECLAGAAKSGRGECYKRVHD